MVKFIKLKTNDLNLVSEIIEETDGQSIVLRLKNPMEIHTEEFLSEEGDSRHQFTILIDWIPQSVTTVKEVLIRESDILVTGDIHPAIEKYYFEVVRSTYENNDIKYIPPVSDRLATPVSSDPNVVSFSPKPKKPKK